MMCSTIKVGGKIFVWNLPQAKHKDNAQRKKNEASYFSDKRFTFKVLIYVLPILQNTKFKNCWNTVIIYILEFSYNY